MQLRTDSGYCSRQTSRLKINTEQKERRTIMETIIFWVLLGGSVILLLISSARIANEVRKRKQTNREILKDWKRIDETENKVMYDENENYDIQERR